LGRPDKKGPKEKKNFDNSVLKNNLVKRTVRRDLNDVQGLGVKRGGGEVGRKGGSWIGEREYRPKSFSRPAQKS